MIRGLSFVSAGLSILILATVFPSDYWAFRVWEYLLFQNLWLLLALLAGWIYFRKQIRGVFWVFPVLLVLAAGYAVVKIFPFFPFASEELKVAERRDSVNDLTILISNVYQKNKHHKALVKLIREYEPDLFLGLETDSSWQRGLASLREDYPYREEALQDNTYGMLLYSRLPLVRPKVHYFIQNDIPSIETEVELPSGRLVKFYGLHPRPPLPGENPQTTEKDKELILVGKRIAQREESYRPVIVAGDFNDVAWSPTTELFRRVSSLLDARRGRGFYNTFPVQVPLLRFPIDHLFCSSHFKLVDFQRLPSIESDHFPIFVHLQSHQPFKRDQRAPRADSTDLEQAEETLQQPTDHSSE